MNSLDVLKQIDRLCDEFEAELKAGQHPRLEEYLSQCDESATEKLLQELVQIQRQYSEEPSPPATFTKPPESTPANGPFAGGAAPFPALLGDYRLIREIGHGGMGVVYEAVQVSLNRRVALKILPTHLLKDDRLRNRFEREARAAGQLHHTNIVPVIGVGESAGQPYFAMQYIEGRNLDKFVSDPKTVAGIGMQIASALDYAHRHQVIHRDVKPSNLLLDMSGTVWITDFGLAKFADHQQLTETGDVLGTIRYMPPEAFEGQATSSGDIYSLGLTLYELVAGVPAFRSEDRQMLLKQVTSESPPALTNVKPDVPRDLATIIHKAIDRLPQARYRSAGELAADLQRFVNDEPIHARRPSIAEQLARWARRNRAVAASLAIISGLLVVGVVASTVMAYRFRNLAGDRETARQAAVDASIESRNRERIERWERYRVGLSAAVMASQFQNMDAMATALHSTPEELRGWEWKHLASRLDSKTGELPDCLALDPKNDLVAIPHGSNQVAIRRLDHPETLKLLPCGEPPTGGKFSPDGTRLAIVTESNVVTLWDTRTWQTLTSIRTETQPINVHFNPNGSELLLESAADGKCFHWRLADSSISNRTLNLNPRFGQRRSDFTPAMFNALGTRAMGVCHDDGGKFFLHDTANDRRLATFDGWAICFSPDGRRMATSDPDQRTISIRSSHDGAVQVTFPRPQNVYQTIWSPDGRWLLAGCRFPTNTATLWDAKTGQVMATLAGHENGIESMAFSPDGRRVVTSSIDMTARLWDVPDGKLIAVLRGHRAILTYSFFSPDGRRIITHAQEPGLKIWDGHTGQLRTSIPGAAETHQGKVFFNERGTRLLVKPDNQLRSRLAYWDTSGLEDNGVIRGHTSFVYDVAFHPDGEQVASASWDGTLRTWNATTGQELAIYRPAKPTYFRSVAYSKDGRYLISTDIAAPSGESAVTRWDCRTRTATDRWTLQGDTEDFRACFDPTNQVVIAGHPDGRPRWYRVGSPTATEHEGHERGVLQSPFASTCSDVAVRPDGRQWASAGFDGTVRFRRFDTPTVSAIARDERYPIHRIVYSPDGKLLASGSYEGIVRLWDTSTFERVAEFRLGTKVYGLAFSPDGSRLACGGSDATIRIWHLPTRSEVASLHGHTDYVHALAFSPDGTRLVSGSGDKTVRIWDSLTPTERAKRSATAQP